MTRTSTAWAAVAALLGVCALVGWPMNRESLDWQPGLAFSQPWRMWSAIAVHYSGLHLAANLVGTLITATFGIAAQVPSRAAWAWLVAWPLTQLGLLIEPGLLHFGGLSGVLHAGVVIVIVWLLAKGTRAQRIVAMLVLLGYAAKIVSEAPWGPPLRHPGGWDIAIAPIAHATGTAAGALCGLASILWPTRKTRHLHA